MKQLQTLSTKTDYKSDAEAELLKLIEGLQDRCTKLEAILKYQLYKTKPTVSSAAAKAADLAARTICHVSNCLAGRSWNDLSQTRRESILSGLAHLLHRSTTK